MAFCTSWYTGKRVSLVPQYLQNQSQHSSRRKAVITDIVHFADELASESVDNARYGWGLAFADEVEIEHPLHSTRLQSTKNRISTMLTRWVDYSGSHYTKHLVLSWKSKCPGRGLRDRLGAVKRCIRSLAVGDLVPSTPFAVPFVPLGLTGTCVVAIVLFSPFVRPLVVPFVIGTADGMLVSNAERTMSEEKNQRERRHGDDLGTIP